MLNPLPFHLVTDREMLGSLELNEVVAIAVSHGVTTVQLREKNISTRQFVSLAKKLKLILKGADVPLIINDRIDVAMASGADGVHIGQNDICYTDARRILGSKYTIGVTIENKKQFNELKSENVDYFGVSSIYPTNTKIDITNIWSAKDILEISSQTDKPLIGIGGINHQNTAKTINLGLSGIAVVSAICACKNLGEVSLETKKISLKLGGHRESI